MAIVLASQSPRRQELLARIGVEDFKTLSLDIDESYPEGLSPEDTVRYIAKKKCDAAAALCAPDDLIITADTMVFLGNDRLGKPHDETDAFRMLRALSGRAHTVCTGVSVRRGAQEERFAVSTRVFFRPMTDDEIRAYIKTGAQIELNFSQHGWDEYYEDYPTLSYTRTMNYVEIPFLAHLAFGKDRGLQFFIHAGPQIGFLLGDSEKIDGDWDGTVAESYTNITVEQHGKAIDNKFDYGIAGGAGIELRTKAGNFIVEGRYYYALSDFYGSTKKDFFSRSAHGVITAKITYLFDLKK